MKIKKHNILLIIATGIISIGALSMQYANYNQKEIQLKISNEKEKFIYNDNPYYVNKEIDKGNYVNTNIVFLKNKESLYKAKDLFDKGENEKALLVANNINLSSFNALKNDLIGDIYLDSKKYKLSIQSYEKAILEVKNNPLLKDMIFNKLQYAKSLL